MKIEIRVIPCRMGTGGRFSSAKGWLQPTVWYFAYGNRVDKIARKVNSIGDSSWKGFLQASPPRDARKFTGQSRRAQIFQLGLDSVASALVGAFLARWRCASTPASPHLGGGVRGVREVCVFIGALGRL